MATNWLGLGYSSGCRSTPLIMEKMAVLAANPKAKVSTAMALKPGDLRVIDEVRIAVLARVLEAGSIGYFATDAQGIFTSLETRRAEGSAAPPDELAGTWR